MTTNPLLIDSHLPCGVPPFDLIQLNHYEEALEIAIRLENQRIYEIENSQESPSVENTIIALENATKLRTQIYNTFWSTVNTEKVQTTNITTKILSLINKQTTSLYNRRILRERVESLKPYATNMNSEDARLLDQTCLNFELNGSSSSDDTRMTEIELEIRKRVMSEDRMVLIDTIEELQGLSMEQIKNAGDLAAKQGHPGKYVIELKGYNLQSITPLLKCENTRKIIEEKSRNRNMHGDKNDTRDLILELVKLRQNKAKKMGFKNWSDYANSQLTLSDSQSIKKFLDALVDPLRHKFEQQQKTNVELSKHDVPEASDFINYFEFESVIQKGLFYMASVLYNLTFVENAEIPTWHPDVRVFEVRRDNELIGMLYMDAYSRKYKRVGVWTSIVQDELSRYACSIYFNFNKPEIGRHLLLDCASIRNVFHEFGHALHGLLSKNKYRCGNGLNGPVDFVEVPSTLNEKWAFHPEVLSNYAIHHQTGEHLSQQLVRTLCEQESKRSLVNLIGVLSSSFIDQNWSTETMLTLSKMSDFNLYDDSVIQRDLQLSNVLPMVTSCMSTQMFGNRYGGRYYTYLLADYLTANIWQYILEQGGFNDKVGSIINEKLLSKGNTMSPRAIFIELVNKEPNIQSFVDAYVNN